jgi:tRNA threonylcarbamoyl adenosine modification protein YeaZ
MITLAIDTSTSCGSVALLDGDRPVFEQQFSRSQLFSVLPANPPDLIVVGVGPGSFTGIRAGIAAAKGLALPRRVPLQSANSFDAIARTALPQMPRDCPQMCVLGDARRDEVYFALYNRTGAPVSDCRIGALEAIEVHNPIWFVSAEMEKYRDALRETFGGFASVCETPVFPSAAALRPADLPLEPIYLRVPDYKTLPGAK